MNLRRIFIPLLLALLTLISAIACDNGSTSQGAIRVGSKDFVEQFILGEMYALVLEDQGFEVERKLNLGGTQVAHASLEAGEIDLYPEYTGTGLLTVLKLPITSDRQQVYQTVSNQYQEKFNLTWLQPAPMNNTYTLLMTPAGAQKYGIQTISDLAAKASQLRMIGTLEFQAREDGLPGLQKAYDNFELKDYKGVDPGLRYQGLINGQAEVVAGFATDGEINAYNLVALKDDKNFFPPYQVAPVVRQAVLEQNPGVEAALNRLSPKITDPVMQHLNNAVTSDQREPAAVAKEFLSQTGLLQK